MAQKLDPARWQQNYDEALASLDADQRAVHDAVLYGEPGVFRISAGAGSGKTKTTVVTIATALNKMGIGLGEVAALTFTRQGAAEMRERLSVLVPPNLQAEVLTARGGSIATFDSWIASRVFRSKLRVGFRDGHQHNGRSGQFYNISWWMKRIADACPTYEKPRADRPPWYVLNGIPGLPGFTGLDFFGRVKEGRDDLTDDEFRQITTVSAIWSRVRAEGLRFDRDDTFRAAIKAAEEFAEATETPRNLVIWSIQKFEEARAALGLWDSIDVMDAYMRGSEDSRRLVFVDESQDNNRVLTRCAIDTARRAKRGGRVALVGDSAQSIFYFRGASPEVFQDLERTEGARPLYLPRNYRSAYQIVQAGNLISEGAQWGMGVPAKATRAIPGSIEHLHMPESMGVLKAAADEIQRRIQEGASPGEFAIIAPTNALVDAAQVQLDLQGIPSVRLGTMAGLWDQSETHATLAWIGLGVSAPQRSTEVISTMGYPKLPYIGAAILDAAKRETDVVYWAFHTGAGTAGQRATLRQWAELVMTLREAYSTLGWDALVAAVATIIVGDDASRTISWSVSEAAVAQLQASGRDYEPGDVVYPSLLWPALIDRVRALLPVAAAKEPSKGDEEDATIAPGPAQAVLTVALILKEYDKLVQHALVCRKTPTVEEDMPAAIADDPEKARAWVETSEQLRKHRVSVCTVWVSKGLEWHTVFGVCPRPMFDDTRNTFPAQAEERNRLLYVMTTRAAERIVFCTYTVRGISRLPRRIEDRVVPYAADQQRLQGVVDGLQETKWRVSGVVRGIQDANWSASHPITDALAVTVRPLERSLLLSYEDQPTYVTDHEVSLVLHGTAFVIYRAISSPLAAGWASAVALQTIAVLSGVIPAEHKTLAMLKLIRDHLGPWMTAHSVPGRVLGDGEEVPLVSWDSPPPHVTVKQRYLAWLLAEGLTHAYQGLRDLADDVFESSLTNLGMDVRDLCGKQPPAPPPHAGAQPTVGQATVVTDLADIGQWVTYMPDTAGDVQRDRWHTIPYPKSDPDEGSTTQLGVFLGVEGGPHDVTYTSLRPNSTEVQQMPVREGSIVVALTTRRVGDFVDTQGTASRVSGTGTLAPLVSWRLPPSLATEIRHRIRRAVLEHLLSSLDGAQPAPLGSWDRILYEVGVGLFLTAGKGFTDPSGPKGLYQPGGQGTVVVPLLLPKTSRVA